MVDILILDNDPTVCSMVRAALRETGLHLNMAPDAAQALQIVANNTPDLLLVDIETLDGAKELTEFLDRLATYVDGAPCQVILTSAISKSMGQDLAKNLGAVDFFGKPFSPIKLRKRLLDLFPSAKERPRLAQFKRSQVFPS